MRPDFAPSARVTGAVIGAITDEQLGRPTPSPAHTVGDLVDHVEGLAVGPVRTAGQAAEPDAEAPRDGDALEAAAAGMVARPAWRPGG